MLTVVPPNDVSYVFDLSHVFVQHASKTAFAFPKARSLGADGVHGSRRCIDRWKHFSRLPFMAIETNRDTALSPYKLTTLACLLHRINILICTVSPQKIYSTDTSSSVSISREYAKPNSDLSHFLPVYPSNNSTYAAYSLTLPYLT